MMLRWNAVLVLFLCHFTWLRAGEPLFVPHGAGSMGMAFAVTATPGQWNCFHNQALLTTAGSTGFSATMENRFMMPALSTKAVSAVLALNTTPLGAVVSHYGNADYHTIFTGLGSAVRLNKEISLGLQVDYIAERSIGEYRDMSHITFETGLTCNLSSSLTLGLHLFNPIAPLNTLPSSVEAGLQWNQSDDLLIAFTTSKVSGEPLSVQCGLNWSIIDRIIIRSGYRSSPSAFSFGIGFKTAMLQADAGFIMNGMTGISSSLTVIWIIR